MSGALSLAAQRINTATAGLTGKQALPVNEPGAPLPASPTEVADLLPTEFGGLTHLFGGGESSPAQYAPVNPALEIPGGSSPGKLGGLAPDFTNAAQNAQQAALKVAPKVAPISAAAKNYVSKARAFLKI